MKKLTLTIVLEIRPNGPGLEELLPQALSSPMIRTGHPVNTIGAMQEVDRVLREAINLLHPGKHVDIRLEDKEGYRWWDSTRSGG